MSTKISWTDETWNPITGCTKISPGCKNCYAERMARRLAGRHGYPEAPHHFDVTLRHDRLDEPLKWRKPRKVFVCSMSDWLHPDVPFSYAALMLVVMSQSRQHAYQLLTKRADRLLPFFHWAIGGDGTPLFEWPLPNVWLGVSVESPDYLWRVDDLLQIPAAMRFVSLEPMLSAIDLCRPERPAGNEHPYLGTDSLIDKLDWVIIGAESGPKCRPFDPAWALDVYEQCRAAGVPFFGKQASGLRPGVPLLLDGHEVKEWPHGG